MNEDLHLSPRMYSTISSLFLVGFILGQLPGTLLLRQLLPHRQVCYRNVNTPPTEMKFCPIGLINT